MIALYIFFIVASISMIAIAVGRLARMKTEDNGQGTNYIMIIVYSIILAIYTEFLMDEVALWLLTYTP